MSVTRNGEELLRFNDVELYDTRADQHEMSNLAAGPQRRGELPRAAPFLPFLLPPRT